MKKILFILMLLPFFSCNDWLDVESEKSVTYLNYFKSEQDLEKVLISMFNNEKGIFAPYHVNAFGWAGLPCDNAGDYEGYRKLEPAEFFNKMGMEGWSGHYSAMYLVDMLEENQFRFENISDERAKYWLAQANFVKALMYFDLVQNWGEVPLAPGTESTEAEGKSTVDVILKEAIRCAEVALILPTHDKLMDANGNVITSKQYASLGTVHTLLANIYAWMGGLYGDMEYWKKAEEHASLVIDGKVGFYDLEKTISLLIANTLGANRTSDETIFAIEINETDENRFWRIQFEERYPGLVLVDYPYSEMNPQEIESNYRKPWISVRSVLNLYPDRKDERRDEYWYRLGEVSYWEDSDWDDDGNVIDSVEVISKYAFLNKWRDPIRTVNPSFIDEDGEAQLLAMEGNRVVWRLADLILLRAECRARLGEASAVSDLNRIRNRAGLEDYDGRTDSESLRKEIFLERERELFGEGQRYYDVVRNGYFREELSSVHAALTDNDIRDGALYLPVSRNSFIKNPLMKQNIYWSWRQQ